MSIVITATGTDVGKTILAGLIMAKYATKNSLQYWKPIQTGMINNDSETIKKFSGLDDSYFFPNSYHFKKPASPHYAAFVEGSRINLHKIMIDYENFNTENLIIEGAGGIYVPLNDSELMLDLFKRLNLPLILVVDSVLGTINSSLLSIEILKRSNINVLGFYMYGLENELLDDNMKTIEKFSGINCLGNLSLQGKQFEPLNFQKAAIELFDQGEKILQYL